MTEQEHFKTVDNFYKKLVSTEGAIKESEEKLSDIVNRFYKELIEFTTSQVLKVNNKTQEELEKLAIVGITPDHWSGILQDVSSHLFMDLGARISDSFDKGRTLEMMEQLNKSDTADPVELLEDLPTNPEVN